MAEARALKLCTKGHYIKSGQSNDKSPQKGHGFAHVTHFCIRICGLRKISSLHAVIGGINKIDDGLLLIAPTVVEATLRLRPKFHRFDFSLYLLQSWLYNIYTKN